MSIFTHLSFSKILDLNSINTSNIYISNLWTVYSGPISTTNSGANGTSIPDETEPLILN